MLGQEHIIKRDCSLDTLKLYLIAFVTYGHIIEEFGTNELLGTVRAMIYCFHMPAFVFLSGYFSKRRDSKKTILNCVLPYILFNFVFSVISRNFDLFTPKYLYWYLLSLFFWRTITIYIPNRKWIICVLLLSGIYVGYVIEADRFLAISRTICFLPYFVAGLLCTERTLDRIRKVHLILAINGILLCELIVVILDISHIMPNKMYEMIECYQKTLGETADCLTYGLLLRSAVYMLGFAMVFFILALSNSKQTISWRSTWGMRTITIYCFSGIIIKLVSQVIKRAGILHISPSPWLVLIIAIPITIITIWLCGNKYAIKLYKSLFSRITHIIQPQNVRNRNSI